MGITIGFLGINRILISNPHKLGYGGPINMVKCKSKLLQCKQDPRDNKADLPRFEAKEYVHTTRGLKKVLSKITS